MSQAIGVGQRVKDGAGHFGTVKEVRPQPRAVRGDAALVEWEGSQLRSWRYVADLAPAKRYGRRRKHTLETELAVADYVEEAGRDKLGY